MTLDAWEVLDGLESLVGKSLVAYDEATGRYRLLETVRHYAAERLGECGEEAEVFAHHASFFCGLAAKEGPTSYRSVETMRRLSPEGDNLRAALNRGTPAERLEMVGCLMHFWVARGAHSEALERTEAALREDDPPSDDARRFNALSAAGFFAMEMGRLAEAVSWAEQALPLARALGDTLKEVNALNTIGCAAKDSGDFTHARETFEGALRIREQPYLLNNLANVLVDSGDYSAAAGALDRCAAILRDEPNGYSQAYCRFFRGRLHYRLGHLDEAEMEVRAGTELATSLESATLLIDLKILWAECRRAQGRPEDALAMACEAVANAKIAESREEALIAQARAALALDRAPAARTALSSYFRSHTPYVVPLALDVAASLLATAARPREATLILGATAAARLRRPTPVPPVDAAEHAALRALLHETLGAEIFAAVTAEGAAMDLEEASAFALQTLEHS